MKRDFSDLKPTHVEKCGGGYKPLKVRMLLIIIQYDTELKTRERARGLCCKPDLQHIDNWQSTKTHHKKDWPCKKIQ